MSEITNPGAAKLAGLPSASPVAVAEHEQGAVSPGDGKAKALAPAPAVVTPVANPGAAKLTGLPLLASPVAEHEQSVAVATPQPREWTRSFDEAFGDKEHGADDLSKAIAEGDGTQFEAFVCVPSMGYKKRKVSHFETPRMTVANASNNKSPKMLSDFSQMRFVSSGRSRQEHKLMFASCRVKVMRDGQEVVKFGGYTTGMKPRQPRFLIKKRTCSICKLDMIGKSNLCMVMGCFHVYHQKCASLPLGCPYYPHLPYGKGPSDRKVKCNDCFKTGAQFMFGESDEAPEVTASGDEATGGSSIEDAVFV